MDISEKTVSTDANSSLNVKSGDQYNSDNINRGNLRHLEDNMQRNHIRFSLSNENNNKHFEWDELDSPTQINISENWHASPESTSTNNHNDSRYPILEVMSDTHIHGHNILDDTQKSTCKICHKKFLSSSSSLDRDVLVQKEEHELICNNCNVKFTSNGNMHRHMHGNNSNDGKRKTTDKDGTSMKRRLKTTKIDSIHKETRRPLQAIQEVSTRKREPRINVTSSRGLYNRYEEEPQDACAAEIRKMKLSGKFPCKLCKTVLPHLRALKKHNRIIHVRSAGSESYRCNICLFPIRSKKALIAHMTRHKGDQRYKCSICSSSFKSKDIRASHLSYKHGINKLIKPDVVKTEREKDVETIAAHQRPIDSSIDVSDLSRKSHETVRTEAIKDKEGDEDHDDEDKVTVPNQVNNQQMFTPQQQFVKENFQKIDPAYCFQLWHFYRNSMYPTAAGFPLHPLSSHIFLTPGSTAYTSPHQFSQAIELQQRSPSLSQAHVNHVKSTQIPNHSPQNQQQLPSSTQTNLIHNFDPAKMVIEDGVIMPKHKQRRYRPFPCEHCSSRFTLRTNVLRHIKQKHPQWMTKRQRKRHNRLLKRSRINNFGKIIPPIHPQQLPPQAMKTQRRAISDHVKYTILAQEELELIEELNEAEDLSIASTMLEEATLLEKTQMSISEVEHCDLIIASNLIPRDTPINSYKESTSMQFRGDIYNGNTLRQQHEDNEEFKLNIDEDIEPLDLSVAKRIDSIILEEPTRLKKFQIATSEVKDFEILHGYKREESNSTFPQEQENDEELESTIDENIQPEDLSVAKRVDSNLLEEATLLKECQKDYDFIIASNLIPRETSSKSNKEIVNASKREKSNFVSSTKEIAIAEGPSTEGVLSISKLVDNATTFDNYLRPDITVNEYSDEEVLRASGSAAESNNYGRYL